jgi:hypothetical protein
MPVDLKEYAHKVLEIAQQNLRNDGYLAPVAFLVTPEQELEIVELLFEGEEEKQQAYAELVRTARRLNAMAIITLNDARYEPHPGSPYTRPGQLEEEGAPECILITISGPGIESWDVISPYTRSDEGIVFGETEEHLGGQINLLGDWAAGKPGPPS